MGLRIIDCNATQNAITVFFSDAVDGGAIDSANYAIDLVGSGEHRTFQSPMSYDSTNRAVTGNLNNRVDIGTWLTVVVNRGSVKTPGGELLGDPPDNTIVAQVNGEEAETAKNVAKATEAVEDAVTYPVLTEEIGYAPSPLARPSTSTGTGGGMSLGQMATKAINDVLGWKMKSDDAKGFMGALSASFTGMEVDGHTEWKWSPRTYAVQTDLSGGITGAQASIYTRAKDALDKSLPLLDGLYALDQDADQEDVAALKAVARSQLTELVNELGMLGGPRVSRVNQYFSLLLLGPETFSSELTTLPHTDPDQIGGTLGNLRDELGLNFTTQDFVNTVEDEQDLSNFRILSDYVTSLAQSWLNNRSFFGLDVAKPFYGTQLVLLSRQLSVVAESVDEVRFAMDSVFIGPAERQTMELHFDGDPALFVEDLLNWIQRFATEEGPRLIQDGGKFGVQNTFFPVATQLQRLVHNAQDPNPANISLPRGFHTTRVQRSLQELADQLQELVDLAQPVKHIITEEPTPIILQNLVAKVNTLTSELDLLNTLLPREPQPDRGPGNLAVLPPSLTFKEQQVKTVSDPPQSILLFNFGGTSLAITDIAIEGDAPNDFHFQIMGPLPLILPGPTPAPLLVTFTPTQPGVREATLIVTFTPEGEISPPPATVFLTGSGKK